MARRCVTVFGSSRPAAGTPRYQQAYDIGRIVARYGWELVNGGYSGTMEASARGARDAGGTVTGITVQTFKYARPNPFLTRTVTAADLYERLRTLIDTGDLYVVLPGGTGTLVELGLVWEFCHKGSAIKPVLVDAFWKPLSLLLTGEVTTARLPGDTRDIETSPLFSENLARDLEKALSARSGD
jgi:uncharacterized protein (TIGR00730 family)